MNASRHLERRRFLKSIATLGTAGIACSGAAGRVLADDEHAHTSSLIAPGDVVLFQGDSITDAGRSRETAGTPNVHSTLGDGYAWMAAAGLLTNPHLQDLNIYNRGISGNKVFQLAERWQEDCLDLEPDVLSILIGVNDIWHAINGDYEGTQDTYANDYRALLTRTKEALPDVKLVICEPFVLRCGAINDDWFPRFDGFRESARSLAEEFHAVFVPFQTMFDAAVAYAEPAHWAGDGVHPSPYGASLMAQHWLMAVGHHAETH
jgi:lysophospholipase L1-like esterase